MRGLKMPSNFEISECGTGAVHRRPSPPSAIHSHPYSHSTDSNRILLGCVPEEKEFIMEDAPSDTDSAKWLWDNELERQGLFRGT
jgi:hypothetical protein